MAEIVKFSDSEMEETTELRTKMADMFGELGQLSLTRLLMEKELNAIRDEELKMMALYEELAKQENDLVTKLLNKYGAGSLDLSTGEFTPEK